MQREPIIFVGTSDLSGHFRGKSFPAADLPARLQRGVGLAPTNIFMSAFGPIQVTTFGTQGEVFLIPDSTTRVLVPFEGSTAEHFFLGDIRTLEGAPWDFCPRQVLRRAVDRLLAETGLRLLATFEQEFTYSGVAAHPPQPYELDGYRRQGIFGEVLLAAMRQAGVIPDSFLAEFGPQQFEVTSAPALGVRAADDAVITRELAQAVAFRLGHRVSFAPIPEPNGTGNGTHIHWSFLDRGRAAHALRCAPASGVVAARQPVHRGHPASPAGIVRGHHSFAGVVLSAASQSVGSGAGGCRAHGPRGGGQDLSGGRRRSCPACAAVQC